jgi:hypothetical protein
MLLSSWLLGVSVKVVVNGSPYTKKEMVVTIATVNEKPCIMYNHYNTSTILDPSWVSPKYPNAKRDNGLLVVIKGEHSGKYVRRIHHRSDDGMDFVHLAVVKRVEGSSDVLSGEQFELGVNFLCLGNETKDEKNMNGGLMKNVRENARRR